MYLPPHFAETRVEALRQLIDEYPLATVVTLGPAGLVANHIPLEYDPEPEPWGMLRGHVARANRVWQDSNPAVEALAIFQGPQRYISPSSYPTKAQTGMVVPTYNYMVVHVAGPLRIVDDPAWLHALVTRLTNRFEADQESPPGTSPTPPPRLSKRSFRPLWGSRFRSPRWSASGSSARIDPRRPRGRGRGAACK